MRAVLVLVALGVLAGGPRPASAQAASPAAARPVIDEATLRREYDAYRKSLEGMKRYGVRYLLVATEDEARQAIARIRSGGDFAEIARRQSLHAESAASGGDLGAHAGCRWARETVTMLDGLEPGQLGPRPVKASKGWGVYRLESKTAVVPRTFERYRDELLAGEFQPECPWQPPVSIAAPRVAPGAPSAVPSATSPAVPSPVPSDPTAPTAPTSPALPPAAPASPRPGR